jgi:hypothetical protein
VDAAHFVLSSFLDWMWCKARIYVRVRFGVSRQLLGPIKRPSSLPTQNLDKARRLRRPRRESSMSASLKALTILVQSGLVGAVIVVGWNYHVHEEQPSSRRIKRQSSLAEQSRIAAIASFDSAVRLVDQLHADNILTEDELLLIYAARDKSASCEVEGSPKMFRSATTAMVKMLLVLHPEVSGQISTLNQNRRQ